MKIKTLKNKILYIGVLAILSCSSGGGNDDDPVPPPSVNPPTASLLEFPLINSECTEGTNITSTESTITFNWANANNTDSYQLVLKNLESQTITNYNSNISEVNITVTRGTPFSWYVISKSNSTIQTATSVTWKFYNAGVAANSYAPFPAELVSPVMGTALNAATTSITLEWSGSDVDSDIIEYDVFFGVENPPITNQGNTALSNMAVNVTSGNTYYWRVVTKDSQNNTSNSEIFQFKIN